jgi:hypothetical protein
MQMHTFKGKFPCSNCKLTQLPRQNFILRCKSALLLAVQGVLLQFTALIFYITESTSRCLEAFFGVSGSHFVSMLHSDSPLRLASTYPRCREIV